MSEPTPQAIVEDREILHQRLQWLIRLRWYAASSIIAATFIGVLLLGIKLYVPVLILLATVMGLYNAYYHNAIAKPDFNPRLAFDQLLLDVVLFTLVLLVSGGFLNPFFTFYFSIVLIAWIILPPRESLIITFLVAVGFVLQWFSLNVDMRLSNEGLIKLGELPFHVIGAPISFIVMTGVTAYFVSVIMRDLRKREREVRQARQQTELELTKLDDILRHLEAGMLVLSSQGETIWVNDRIVSWFGTEGVNSTDSSYRLVRYPMGLLTCDCSRLDSSTDKQLFHETRIPTLSGATLDFEILITPVCDASGNLRQINTLVLDVTEQKKQQAQWSQTQKLAAIGQLAAGVAHEINTPLGTISILAQEAQSILAEIPKSHEHASDPIHEELFDSLTTITGQIHRCKEITQGLLNFSRKSDQTWRLCSINTIVKQALELAKPKTASIQITEHFDDSLPELTTDTTAVERAVLNLLINAADALEEDETPCINIRTTQENSMLVVEISDNGQGIHSDDLPHIFEPFFTTKAVGKGTGLGLYITYGIICDLGGDLKITSQLNQGTQAIIRLPIGTHEAT